MYAFLLVICFVGVGFPGHRLWGCSALLDSAKQYFRVVIPIYTPTCSVCSTCSIPWLAAA